MLRIFINQAKIESVLLAETRREGDQNLLKLVRGGICWSADFYRVQRYPLVLFTINLALFIDYSFFTGTAVPHPVCCMVSARMIPETSSSLATTSRIFAGRKPQSLFRLRLVLMCRTARRCRVDLEKLTPTFSQKSQELQDLRKQFEAKMRDIADLEVGLHSGSI